MSGVDCLHSAFSRLKIRQVLILASAIANNDVCLGSYAWVTHGATVAKKDKRLLRGLWAGGVNIGDQARTMDQTQFTYRHWRGEGDKLC